MACKDGLQSCRLLGHMVRVLRIGVGDERAGVGGGHTGMGSAAAGTGLNRTQNGAKVNNRVWKNSL